MWPIPPRSIRENLICTSHVEVMIIEDDRGWMWAIHNGDPAAALIVRLSRLGFRRIVLPQATIIGGVPTDSDVTDASGQRVERPPSDGSIPRGATTSFECRA